MKIMQKHTKNYIEAWNIGEQDFYMCEISGCSRACTDIHHIEYKSQLGSDDFENLLGVCRVHHNEIHQEKYSKDWLRKMKKYPYGHPKNRITMLESSEHKH